MPATWKFVDQPVASPSVLLDMHNGTTWRTSPEGFDVSPPPLRRSIVSNQMTDGGLLTAASYELRELKFTVRLHGETEADRIAQLTAFETELAKPFNLLMYKPDLASTPVFFRTLRSDSFTLDNQFIPGEVWQITASVLAEPFAIGTRVDLPQVTVANDPAAVTNPARFDLTGITGDAPSPAFVRISDLGAGNVLYLGQRTANNPTALTNVAQAEAGTLGTDTTAVAGGATFSGAGSNAASCTFATVATMNTRTTVTVPTSPAGTEAKRGRYRVLVRAFVPAGATATTFRFVVRQFGTDQADGPLITAAVPTNAFRLIDLGVIEWPHASTAPQAIGYSGLTPTYPSSTLGIRAERVSGNGTLQLDYVYLMPADERFCSVLQGAASGYLVLDGPNDATYCMGAGTDPFSASASSRLVDSAAGMVPRIGGLPLLVPGVTNRWFMLTDTGTVASTKTVNVSYWPRWREVAV